MVRIGVRPKNVRVSKERTSEDAFQLPVYVTVREAKNTVITFELTHTFFQGLVDNGQRMKIGDKVWVDIEQDGLYFFKKSVELTK
jgi:ABC-type sugar transport system ATPase subunit